MEGMQKVEEDMQLVEKDMQMKDMRMKDTKDMQDMVELDMSKLVVGNLLVEVQNIEGLEEEEEQKHMVVLMEHMLWLGAATIQITI